MFETYGEEYEAVKAAIKSNPGKVATIVEADNGDDVLVRGWHWVNRIGYLIAKDILPEFDVLALD